jgi:S-formylglutathione hydrolase FrmB
LENQQTRAALLGCRSIVVLPNGGNSWWLDTAPLLTLMNWVQGPLQVRSWSATGWSMGAYGSVRLVERHPDRFTAWAGIIGLLDFPNPQYPKEWNHSVPASFGLPENWAEKNPMMEAGRLRGKRLWFATGETAFDRKMNDAFQDRLRGLGIPFQYELIDGAHTFPVVTALLPVALRFLSEK